jgi:predicted ATPase
MINYVKIEGFKSIRKLELDLLAINILIGGNGAGKSNFISFFKLVSAIFDTRLQQYVIEEKADNILHYGRKMTEELNGKLIFSSYENHNNAYIFQLLPTKKGGLFIGRESSGYNVEKDDDQNNYFHKSTLEESVFATDGYRRNKFLQGYVSALQAFHFHDTSSTSFLRRECSVDDNDYLKPDGRNLPAFLYLMMNDHPKIYTRIFKTIQSVAPYIHKFVLEPKKLKNKQEEIELRWIDIGDRDSTFTAYHLSDGTLRFIALATLLLQPEPPEVIIIDEPELGLHPFAIAKLAGMMKSVSDKAQLIVATQSPGLISHFSPEDIIVADRDDEEAQSVFKRLNSKSLKQWINDYSLGDMWERNIFNSGQPFIK